MIRSRPCAEERAPKSVESVDTRSSPSALRIAGNGYVDLIQNHVCQNKEPISTCVSTTIRFTCKDCLSFNIPKDYNTSLAYSLALSKETIPAMVTSPLLSGTILHFD